MMEKSESGRNEREQQLDGIIAHYYRQADSGNPPDQNVFIAEYPDYETELREFFADVNQMQAAVPPPVDGVGVDYAITVIDNRTLRREQTFVPRSFGDYEILEELGAGGMGVVYKARHKKLGRIVALKMIRAGQLATPQDVQRFQIEVRAHARLSHPGIVAVHEVGSTDGQHFFTMDYVAGGSLSRLHRDEPVSSKRAAKLVRRLAESMHYAHQEGVFHRDLKPANILLGVKGAPQITDFGLAMLQRTDEETKAVTMTETGQILGTAGYMSPEQALGKKNSVVDARSDVYSLGAVLYALLTSRAPFVGESVSDTLLQVIQTDPVSPRVLNPSVPADLETICLKCLEKDQAKRYPTAQALADELKSFIEGKPILARPSSPFEKVKRWSRRNPAITRLMVAIALCLLAGIGGTGYFAARSIQLIGHINELEKANSSLDQALEEKNGDVGRLEDSLNSSSRELGLRTQLSESRLFTSELEKAKALVRSERNGHSLDTWKAVMTAADLIPQINPDISEVHELRDLAIASLALTDLETISAWAGELSPSSEIAVSDDLDLLAIGLPSLDRVLVRRRTSEIADRMEIASGTTNDHSQLRFSGDNRWLSVFDDLSRSVHFHDLQLRTESASCSDVSHSHAVDFHPTRAVAIIGQTSGAIQQVDLQTGVAVPFVTEGAPIACVRYHPDGQHVAVLRMTGVVEIRDSRSAAIENQFIVPAGSGSVAWHPGGRYLAATTSAELQLFDLVAGSTSAGSVYCRGHRSAVLEMFWHPALPVIVSSSNDGTSRLWDVDSGRTLVTVSGRMKGFHRDGSRMAIRRPSGLTIFKLVGPTVLKCMDLQSTGILAMHPTDNLLAASGPDGVRLLDTATNKVLGLLPVGPTNGLSFHPSTGSLTTSGIAGLWDWPVVRSSDANGTVFQIGPPTRTEAALSTGGIVRHSSDGSAMMVADLSNQSVTVLLESGSPSRKQWPMTEMLPMDICLGGQYVAGVDPKGRRIVIWNPEKNLLTELPFSDAPAFLRFSPDGKWLTANGRTSASIWRVDSWELNWTIQLDSNEPAALTFSPDSNVLAVGELGATPQLYEVETGAPIAGLESQYQPPTISDMVFTRDGRQLISASLEEGVWQWDLGTIRSRLSTIHLDWATSPLSTAKERQAEENISLELSLGSFAATVQPKAPD